MDPIEAFEAQREPETREEMTARLQREIAEGEADIARRRYERETDEIVARNSKPPPPPPPPAPAPQRKGYDVLKVLGELTADMHVEMARRDAANRADAANREAVVRTAVAEATQEMRSAVDRIRDEARNSIAGSAAKLLRLREEREATQHDLQRQILTLSRELFEVQRAVAALSGERPKANGLDGFRPNGRGDHA